MVCGLGWNKPIYPRAVVYALHTTITYYILSITYYILSITYYILSIIYSRALVCPLVYYMLHTSILAY